jgi:hypothetical protein
VKYSNLTFGSLLKDKVTSADAYGDSVMVSYRGKRSQQTCLGGIVSILTTCLTIAYASWRMKLMLNRDRDAYYLSEVTESYEKIGAYFLKDS